jgi:IMP cyclohydrolase
MEHLEKSIRVKSVKPLENYRVQVTFQDRTTKKVDIDRLLHGDIFTQIRENPSYFRTVKVIGRTIGWDNGADIDPYVLYYDLKPAWMEETEVTAD